MRKRERQERDRGFRDALVHGARDVPFGTTSLHYEEGFHEGQRAVDRIATEVERRIATLALRARRGLG